MTKTLAFVTYLIVSPPDLAGTQFVTKEPVECVPNMTATVQMFEEYGVEVDVFCDYTSAPTTSPRPIARP